MQLVILLSGHGERFREAGKNIYKPMIQVNSEGSILERLTDCFPTHWSLHFVLNHLHRDSELETYIKAKFSHSKLHYVAANRQGPSRSLLDMVSELEEDQPVFVSYCDYSHVWNPFEFEDFIASTDCDACFVVYKGYHPHYLNPNTYAYCKTEGDRVVDIKEKGSFTSQRETEYASTGGHYIKSAKLLKQALEMQFENKLIAAGEYYLSLAFKALLMKDRRLDFRVFEVPYFFQLGTPEDLQEFRYWERLVKSAHKYTLIAPAVIDLNFYERDLSKCSLSEGFFVSPKAHLFFIDYNRFRDSVIKSDRDCVAFGVSKNLISHAPFSKILPFRKSLPDAPDLYSAGAFWIRDIDQLKRINPKSFQNFIVPSDFTSFKVEEDLCLRSPDSIQQARYFARAFKKQKVLTLINKVVNMS